MHYYGRVDVMTLFLYNCFDSNYLETFVYTEWHETVWHSVGMRVNVSMESHKAA